MDRTDEMVARSVGALREELRGYEVRLAVCVEAGDDAGAGVMRDRCAGVERALAAAGVKGEVRPVAPRGKQTRVKGVG